MESGHFIDASSTGSTITTASGTVVVGNAAINQSGGGGNPKVSYQVSRVVPIASAAVSAQSQIHPVAGEISTVEDEGDGGGGAQTSGGTIQAVLTNGLNGQVSYLKYFREDCWIRIKKPYHNSVPMDYQ